eukprot:CAMPEP_0168341954 /NCGR_PEP_ID=MMETSP0213-20121227/15052_1 /TAXON_ID=151035 /ORGANISM="Euplotes harpa, Strain FSP1.4" /LENGTH=154 /DNA_ID=CAMNT_0008348651 /DNA_START=699 /DNA_END=1163 /DNA_ORIENTATION=-
MKGCNKRFTTQGHLVDHERRHNDEKPYKCEVCGKDFMRSSTLKVHMKTHDRDSSSSQIRIKINKSEEDKVSREESKERPPSLPLLKITKPDESFVQRVISKPKVSSIQPSFQRLTSPVPQKIIERPQERISTLKPSYSLIATVTSSIGEMFDSA